METECVIVAKIPIPKLLAGIDDDVRAVYQLSCTDMTVEEIYSSDPFKNITRVVTESGNTLTDGELLTLLLILHTEMIRDQ